MDRAFFWFVGPKSDFNGRKVRLNLDGPESLYCPYGTCARLFHWMGPGQNMWLAQVLLGLEFGPKSFWERTWGWTSNIGLKFTYGPN